VERCLARIQVAKDSDEVLAALKDYVRTWTPSEIATVPGSAWMEPDSLTGQTVCEHAVQLKVEELRHPGGEGESSLHALARVFAAAALRFGYLESPFRQPEK